MVEGFAQGASRSFPAVCQGLSAGHTWCSPPPGSLRVGVVLFEKLAGREPAGQCLSWKCGYPRGRKSSAPVTNSFLALARSGGS